MDLELDSAAVGNDELFRHIGSVWAELIIQLETVQTRTDSTPIAVR